MTIKSGDKCRLSWQGESDVEYRLIDRHLGYAQLLNIKLNTIKWANEDYLVKA